MRNTRGFLIIATMASMAGLSGCPSSSATTTGAAGAAADVDAAAAAIGDGGDDDDTLPVVCPDGAPDSTSLATGMSAKGTKGKITAIYQLANPNPPERYDNDWTIDFVDANGAPVTDITTTASTWMPYHGHGWPGTTTPMATPGEIKATLNFNMRGYFEIKLAVTSKSLGADNMSLYYCLR